MSTITFAAPILPGRLEAWRRFTQELQGAQREAHAASRRRLGMCRETSYLQQTPQRDLAIVSFDVRDPAAAMVGLATSLEPFDRWFRERVLELHGIDMAQPAAAPLSELAFNWQSAPTDQEDEAGANEAIYRRYVEEVWNERNLAAMDRYFTVDHVDNSPPPGQQPGLEGLKPVFGMFQSAFEEMSVTIDDVVAAGDKVVARTTFRGTHSGPFFGVAPTGRCVTVTQTHILRFVGGKMAEHWSNSDDLGMMRQLGVIPEMGHA